MFRSELVWGGTILVAAALLADNTAAGVAVAGTPAEEWVASRVASEQAADLKDYPCPGATSTADCRALSGDFVARLIAGKVVPPDRWPVRGIELLSAEVRGKLDLTGARVPGRVVVRNSHLTDTVTLDDARFENSLLLACDDFDDTVTGAGLHVAGELSLAGSQVAKQISLVGANIGGFFRAGSHVVQRFDVSNAHIGLTFAFIHPPACLGDRDAPPVAEQGISLDAADVGGNVDIEGRIGHVDSHDAISAYTTHIRGRAVLLVTADGGIDLRRAVIDHFLTLTGSTVDGALQLSGARIGTDAALASLAFEGAVDLNGASVGQTLNLRGPTQPTAGWKVVILNLQNAHVARLRDDAGSWSHVHHQLAGFVYDEFVPPDPGQRPDQGWRRDWLAADEFGDRALRPAAVSATGGGAGGVRGQGEVDRRCFLVAPARAPARLAERRDRDLAGLERASLHRGLRDRCVYIRRADLGGADHGKQRHRAAYQPSRSGEGLAVVRPGGARPAVADHPAEPGVR